VELFEEIRRDFAAGETIKGLARSMAYIGGWCGRQSPARSRRSGRSTNESARRSILPWVPAQLSDAGSGSR